MSELVMEHEDVVQNAPVTQTERINVLIKEVADLRHSINKHKEVLQSWTCRSQDLSMNVWTKNTRHIQLRGTEDQLRTTASEAMKLLNQSEDELANLELRRPQEQLEKWETFQAKRVHYTTNFLQAQAEYSAQNLMKDIEKYRNESYAVNEELLIVKKELADMEKRCGVNDMCVDLEDEDIRNIKKILNAVKKIGDDQLHKIKLTSDAIQEKESEVKHKKIALEELNRKKKKFCNKPIH